MIEVKNVWKEFNIKEHKGFLKNETKCVKAVNGVNIKIEKGKIVGLLGINGAGKTTTIKIITGLLKPTKGNVYVDGKDISKNINKYKGIINMITGGERNIYWRLTPKENLEYYAALYGVKGKEKDIIIDKLIKMLDLEKSIDTPVEQFSKGMKQRLQIARGLINSPKYIFLDEPTLGLDIGIAKEMREYIKKLAQEQNRGILLTTHYLREVEELCDYVYVLSRGGIVREGSVKDIITSVGLKNRITIATGMMENDKINEILNELQNMRCVTEYNQIDNICKFYIDMVNNNEVSILQVFMKNMADVLEYENKEPELEDAIELITARA